MQRWPLKVLGVSHKIASISSRERFYLDEAQSGQLLTQLRDVCDIREAMILSTCHRTEIYYVSKETRSKDIRALLGVGKEEQALFYEQNDAEASIAHLFSVALGRDAQVLGDQQVLHQTKQAYQRSADLQMAAPHLHRLLHSIFYTHKRVAKETDWCDGTMSVPYAAVELIRSLLQNRKTYKILVLGLGDVGKDVSRNLQYLRETPKVYVSNRTACKSEAIAKEYGFESIPFSSYRDYLMQVDVVITCVEHQHYLITKEMLQNGRTTTTPLYLLDLSVPRSIESEVEKLPGIVLHNIDDLKTVTSRINDKRTEALANVERISKEVETSFLAWCEEYAFSPVIQRLKEVLEQLRQEEMANALKGLDHEESKKVDKITRALVQRILKYPVLNLKAACKRGEADTMVAY